jgi:hypothetical protein
MEALTYTALAERATVSQAATPLHASAEAQHTTLWRLYKDQGLHTKLK